MARDTFERELERVRRWYGCFVAGYVVMPEPVHLLISEPERGQPAQFKADLRMFGDLDFETPGWNIPKGSAFHSCQSNIAETVQGTQFS